MTISWYRFTKSDIMSIPSPERECLVTFMVISTEVNTLLTCQLLSEEPGGYPPEMVWRAQLAQRFHLTRLLAATLHEAWLTVQKLFTGCPVAGAKLQVYLGADAREAYTRLKSFYGKPSSTLADVRNRLGFHFDRDAIVKGLSEVPDSELIDMCVSDNAGGHRYPGTALVMANAIGPAVGVADTDEAIDTFLHDVEETAGKMMTLLSGWIGVVVRQYLQREPLTVDVPDCQPVPIPAFCDLSGDQLPARRKRG